MPVLPMGLQTSRVPVAAQVHIAVLLDKAQLQRAHGGNVVVQRRINVPGLEEAGAVRMEEGNCGRELVVVVDYVGEVGHGLVAFIYGRGECVLALGGTGRVNRVYRALPTSFKLIYYFE